MDHDGPRMSRLLFAALRILRTCHGSAAAKPLSFPIAKLDPSNSIPHASPTLAAPRSETHQSPGAQWAKDGGTQRGRAAAGWAPGCAQLPGVLPGTPRA